jgi:hypothetical protein
MIRRRDFVLGCGSLAVLTAIPIANAATIITRSGESKADHFRPLINTIFNAANDAGQVLGLKLVAVEETPIDPRLEQFRLVFESEQPEAEEAIYALTHESGRGLAIDTVSIQTSESDPTGRTYFARFCLFAP